MIRLLATIWVFCLAAAPCAAQTDEPELPAGLAQPQSGKEEPQTEEPALPEGLGEPVEDGRESRTQAAGSHPLIPALSGFAEGRIGFRTQDDPFQKDISIGEGRLQLGADWAFAGAAVRIVSDFLYDDVDEDRAVDLETGRGWLDLREANLLLRPLDFLDVKLGRQILTWGTGDLLFLNDLFPKDFRSFFIGRDDEYLKAPSDALRASFFSAFANLDVVYTPRFDADRFIDGSRLSYFNPVLGRLAGQDAILDAKQPDGWFADDEIALRLYRNVGPVEVAAYAYDGFWKTPQGIAPVSGRPIFPDLRVFGASARGPLAGGIANGEIAYYSSTDDRRGDDPLIRNGEWRVLAGFEREALPEFTVAVQYYAEIMTDDDAFQAALASGQAELDRIRHLLTVRLTKLAFDQTLTLSLFNFWSPNADDGHLRLRASYKLTDAWLAEGGGNVFYGPHQDGFFDQLKDNSNVFFGVRRSF